jgi:glutamate dehydrogenase/leucine dehydrogenase
MFDEVARAFAADKVDYLNHEAVFLEIGEKTNYLHGAFILKTKRGAGAGGVRLMGYNTFDAYLRDGLRLAKGMSRKNALAGIWWGGAKGVVAKLNPSQCSDRAFRDTLFTEYGCLISGIHGCYVTAEDLGVKTVDVDRVFCATRFTTCISESLGGSGNPSIKTGWGVVCGMEAAMDHLSGTTNGVSGRGVAVMGCGNVATAMIGRLLERNVGRVVVADVSPEAVAAAKERFRGAKNFSIRLAKPGDMSILYEDVDIVAPCAVGGVLNPSTIPHIKAKVVCGAANNQLLDDSKDDKLLHARGIRFIVDFVVNRMGIVNCANEQYGFLEQDPAIERHFSRDYVDGIYQVTRRILALSDSRGITELEAAAELADAASEVEHPIWGHRGQQIIDELVRTHWEKKPRQPYPSHC